jgi:hypothetical protein
MIQRHLVQTPVARDRLLADGAAISIDPLVETVIEISCLRLGQMSPSRNLQMLVTHRIATRADES